jgi:hypothetical protein
MDEREERLKQLLSNANVLLEARRTQTQARSSVTVSIVRDIVHPEACTHFVGYIKKGHLNSYGQNIQMR